MKNVRKMVCALLFGLVGLGATAILLVSCGCIPTTTEEGLLYCVIDLSGGPHARKWPVSYLSTMPDMWMGRWTDEYKTTKLVLRRIEAGTFIMGDDQTDKSHRVTLTKPFYMGVFEVTQKQWQLVMGSRTLSRRIGRFVRGTSPVFGISYDDIRGSSLGAQWPASSVVDASSFLGRLRAKTGLDFDLPTEAQWEYACRAETTTTYHWGNTLTRRHELDKQYAWYDFGTPEIIEFGSPVDVGSTIENDWGLYDMSGNVWEMCRDWYGTLIYGTDPKGSASGSHRVMRGGCWNSSANTCTSSYRDCVAPSSTSSTSSTRYGYDDLGFRLSRTLP